VNQFALHRRIDGSCFRFDGDLFSIVEAFCGLHIATFIPPQETDRQ
jgi:hypothetical protein